MDSFAPRHVSVPSKVFDWAECWVFADHRDAEQFCKSERAKLRRGSGYSVHVWRRELKVNRMTVTLFCVTRTKRKEKASLPITHTTSSPGAAGVAQS